MVKKSVLAGVATAALMLGPAFALAQDSQDSAVKKGSLEAAGSGSAASVAQAVDTSDGDFEGALIALPFVAGGGAAAAILLSDGGGGGGSSSTTTATQTAD